MLLFPLQYDNELTPLASVRVAHGNADVGKVTSSAIQLQNIDEAICTTSVPTARRRQGDMHGQCHYRTSSRN